jgi:DNA-directed RNA polymerase subunit N (RpoN/RPB10)
LNKKYNIYKNYINNINRMLYLKCPTCKNILANKQVPYEKDLSDIENDKKLSTNEKNKLREDLLNKYKLDKYCCRMRLLSYTRLIDIVK